jgi:hypothetical protein
MKPKAILLGLVCFILLSAPFVLAMGFHWSISDLIQELYWWLHCTALLISGALTAYLSRQNEIPNAITLGVAIAIFLGIFNFTGSALGLQFDSIGVEGNFIFVLLELPITISFSVVGALCIRLWRKTTKT